MQVYKFIDDKGNKRIEFFFNFIDFISVSKPKTLVVKNEKKYASAEFHSRLY